jgi:hypothetical protein
LRVPAEQSHRRDAVGPGQSFGRTISGENAKEISSLISEGVKSARRGLGREDLRHDALRLRRYALPAK